MCFSSLDINFFVTAGFRETEAESLGQISETFELKNACLVFGRQFPLKHFLYCSSSAHYIVLRTLANLLE